MPPQTPGWPRLAASLALSGALHLTLISQFAPPGSGPAPGPARPLSVSLPALAMAPSSDAASALPDSLATAGDLPEPPAASASPPSAEEQSAPALALLPPAATSDPLHYYPADRLEVHPFALGLIPLHPPALAGYPDSGKLLVELWISDSGKVDRVEVAPSPLPLIFSAVVRQAYAGASFMPARADGRPVACHIRIEVDYAGQP